MDPEAYAEEDPVFRAIFVADRNKRIKKGMGLPGEKLEPIDVAALDQGKYVNGLNSYLFYPGPDVDIITGRARSAAHAVEVNLREHWAARQYAKDWEQALVALEALRRQVPEIGKGAFKMLEFGLITELLVKNLPPLSTPTSRQGEQGTEELVTLFDHPILKKHNVMTKSGRKKFFREVIESFRPGVGTLTDRSYADYANAVQEGIGRASARAKRIGVTLELAMEGGDREYIDMALRTMNKVDTFLQSSRSENCEVVKRRILRNRARAEAVCCAKLKKRQRCIVF